MQCVAGVYGAVCSVLWTVVLMFMVLCVVCCDYVAGLYGTVCSVLWIV